MKTQNKQIVRAMVVLLTVITLSCSKDNLAEEVIAQDVCKTDPCGNTDICPDACPTPVAPEGSITKDDFSTEGTRVETDNGFTIDGKLDMETKSGETISFVEADAELEFNEDGSLKNISGTVEIPSPSNYFEFENPVQADIGFFTGKYLNENRNFEIKLQDSISYFVFAISVAIEMKVGVNDNPGATKPISISPPISGGHITLIADYNDPMYFYSLGIDGSTGNNDGNGNTDDDGELSGVSFGLSKKGQLSYDPILPVDNVVSFDAKSVTGGTFSFWGVLQTKGMYYKNSGFDTDFNLKEPMNSTITAGYRAGINGTMNFSANIKNIVSFTFPMGKGSAAVVAEANTDGEIGAQAFVNGLIDPDLSWWPNFIPVKPDGTLSAYGYVEETGFFDMGLSGDLSLELLTKTQRIEGEIRATAEAFTMAGKVVDGEDEWEAEAIFTKDETKCISTPPNNFGDDISKTVTEQIDNAIAKTEKAREELEKANEEYELEFSLRGLRAVLPGILTDAENAIDAAAQAGTDSGESQINNFLSDNNRVLCSDNLSGQITSIVRGHRNAVTRLKNAIAGSDNNDTEQTRTELEAALRHLAGLDKIDRTFSVTIIHGGTVFRCTRLTRTDTRSVTVKRTILTTNQKSQLLEAADNVKFIKEADGLRIDAQLILDQLPTVEELEKLKDGVKECVDELTNGLSQAGFTYNHNSKEYTFFIIVNGEEIEVDGFDVFNKDELIAIARPEIEGCNPEDALKQLVEKAKR